MSKDMVTSIRIDADLWKKAKIHAINKGMKMRELIERLLKKELEEDEGDDQGL